MLANTNSAKLSFIRLMPEEPAAHPKKGRVAVTAFGLEWDEAEPLLAVVKSQMARQKRVPIFVLTTVAPKWLANPEDLTEMLPTRAALCALEPHEWASWVNRRWDILKAKWDIRSEIPLGQSFEDFMEQEREKAAA
jgi:hypothetical protein